MAGTICFRGKFSGNDVGSRRDNVAFRFGPACRYGRGMTDLHLHPSLREPAQTSKAWPCEEARKLVKRYPEGKPGGEAVIFETGYGPSGLPHIGTFNEVLRTTMVRRRSEERRVGKEWVRTWRSRGS